MSRGFALVFSCLMVTGCNNASQNPGDKSGNEKALAPYEKGEMIFKTNCTTCHSLNTDLTGPAVYDALTRWHNDTSRLKAFIRNPPKLIAEGDSIAVKSQKKYVAVMPAFPTLSDEDLDNLIAYFQHRP